VVLEIVLPNERAPADELADVAADARDAGLALEAVVPCPAAYLKSWQPNEAWPEVSSLEEIYAAARRIFPGVLIGGGMLSYFTELNRKRPPLDAIDFITHTVCPIVHDADDRTVMDNLEALPPIAESIRAIAGDKPYRLGPSAIGMRQNPYGASPVDNLDNGRVAMAINDPRQRGLFGAAWNLGLIAHAARAGIEALALAAPSGASGIVYRTLDWSQPWFDERGRGIFPLFQVLADLARAAGGPRIEATASDGRAIQALAYRDGDETVLWLANLTAEPCLVRLEGLGSTEAEVARLDAPSFAAITSGPDGFCQSERLPHPDRLELDAFAVARIRLRG
jgi:D-apionolactonase